jgi:CubicO group peptidase (beta-lactamase class C family)
VPGSIDICEADSIDFAGRNWSSGFSQYVAALKDGRFLRAEFVPGTQYQYSGEGFSYLQSVVEAITGTSFERFMLDHILVPLGMTASGITWDMTSVRTILT